MKSENTRLPRGSRPVAQAFLTALDAITAKSRPQVAKAALGIIKEGLAQRKDEARQEAADEKASRRPVAVKRIKAAPSAGAVKSAKAKAKRVNARKPQAAKLKLTVVPSAAAA